MMSTNESVWLAPGAWLSTADRLFDVNKADIDQVYALGGRFDTEQRTFYVPTGVDPAPFAPWLASLRASSYGVILAKLWCVHCANLTRVAGLVLPAGHEGHVHRGGVERQWIAQSNRFIPSYIDVLEAKVLARIRGFAPKFERVVDETWGEVYQNHCEQCGALHSDRELYRDVDGALDYRLIDSTAVELVNFNESFLGRSGDGIDADQLESNPDLLIRVARQRSHRKSAGAGG